MEGEHFAYKIKFANDAAKALGFEFEASKLTSLPFVNQFTNVQVGATYLADLTAAEITLVSSTTVTVDAGVAPISGGGIEVRWSDTGWGRGDDRNLVGRFTSQTFTIRDCRGCRIAIYSSMTIQYRRNTPDSAQPCIWTIHYKKA